jgi:ubiquitin
MPATYDPISKASFSFQTPTWLNPLLADGHDVTSRKGTVASGIGILKRGAILKIVAATGVITVPAAAGDCNCVLVDDIDATSATVQAGVYLTGRMKADAIQWPGALSHADCTEALRDVGIYLESVIIADGSLAKSTPTEAEAKEAIKNLKKARDAVKETEEAAEEEKQPPSDSPFQYLTPDEKADNPGLATSALGIAAEEFAEEQQENPKEPKREQPKPPPPQKPPEPHRR